MHVIQHQGERKGLWFCTDKHADRITEHLLLLIFSFLMRFLNCLLCIGGCQNYCRGSTILLCIYCFFFATNNDETLEKWMNIIFIRYDLYIFLEFMSYLIPIGVIMSYLWIKDVEGFRL